MHWFRRLIAGTFALAVTVAIVGGTPVLLLRVAGNPLPKQLPTMEEVTTALTSPDNGALFLRLLALVGWLAWATFTISVLIEIPAQLRGRRAKRIPGMKVQQKVAAALVGSMIAVFAGASVAHAMIAAPVQAKPPAVATMVTSTQQATQQQMVYVVVRGDYLGRIAERFTGDFDSYREIAALNPKLIRNPNHIEPGWKVVLPERSVDRGIMSHATGKLHTPGTAPAAQPPPVQKPPPPPVVQKTPSPPPVVEKTKAPVAQAPQQEEKEGDNALHAPLAAGAGIAAASVLAAHVIVRRRQVRRRRQMRIRRPRRVEPFLPPEDNAARQMAKHRAADRLDAGLRRLSVGLRGRLPVEMPDIAAVWQNGGDLAVVLTSPCDEPPEPFEERWQNTWSLPATVKLPDSSWAPSPLPGLLTFATWPQGGELLVDCERTGLLTITGDPAGCEDLLRCLAAEAATAPWADGASVQIAGLSTADMRSLASLNPARVRFNASIPDALARLGKRALANAAILQEAQIADIMLARLNNMTEASWLTHLLFVADPWGEHTAQLLALDSQLAGLRRVGVAVVVTHPTATRWSATVSADGSLHMAWLAVAGAQACQLTTDHLADMAEATLDAEH